MGYGETVDGEDIMSRIIGWGLGKEFVRGDGGIIGGEDGIFVSLVQIPTFLYIKRGVTMAYNFDGEENTVYSQR